MNSSADFEPSATGPPARYRFHFSPRRGWMNDPNGLIELHGVAHLFFQHNPESPTFGAMHWGHATSTDLATWTEQPIALTPGDDGDYDRDGCWSGCAMTLPDGRIAVLYSANRHHRQLPAVAIAADPDLLTWRKCPTNPVVGVWPALDGLTDLRDHAVLRDSGRWRQVLAAGRDTTLTGERGEHSAEDLPGGGMLLSYLADGDDVTSWTFDSVLLDAREADLPGEVWECPDIFTVPGTDGEVVVIMSWYTRESGPDDVSRSDVVWLTGPLAGGRFTPTRYGRLDLGDRFYAPQSYPTADGRRLMYGWLRTQLDPASAGELAVGAASLPRQLSVVDGRVHQRPAAEIDALGRTAAGRVTAANPSVELSPPATALELVVGTGHDSDLAAVRLELTATDGHTTVISLAAFDRPTTWVRRDGTWVADAQSSSAGGEVRRSGARVLVDSGLVEIFTDDGRAAATSDLALDAVKRVTMTARADAGCTVEVLVIE